jgi:putative transcriptional regulator
LTAALTWFIVYEDHANRGGGERLIPARMADSDEEEAFNSQQSRGDEERVNEPFCKDTHLLPEYQTDWARLEAMTSEQAHANALADEDSQPLTPAQLARMQRVPNPRAIRLQLQMTQEEFARQFQIALGTLRDWEQGARVLNSTAKAYLRVIERNPGAVLLALRGETPNHWRG